MLAEAIKQCENLWPKEDIEIGAQEYLLAFYRKFGFVQISQMYLEDDIPHVDMKRKAVA